MGFSTFPIEPGQTPLSDEEKLGLIPSYINTVGELNEWEYDNILRGQKWAFSRRRKTILSEEFIRKLHKKMFGETWDWAGEYRKSDKNIGVPAYMIPTEIREVLDTAKFWEGEQSLDIREIAVRLHHRLVKVHPFPNGNGRHTRMFADVYLYNRGQTPFEWGGRANLASATELRRVYLDALQQADNLNYAPLLNFADK